MVMLTVEAHRRESIVVLENDEVRVAVDCSKGGRVSSYVWKATAHDWIPELTPPALCGLSMDFLREQSWLHNELKDAPYEAEVVESGPERVAVRLSRLMDGKGDPRLTGPPLPDRPGGDGPAVRRAVRWQPAPARRRR